MISLKMSDVSTLSLSLSRAAHLPRLLHVELSDSKAVESKLRID